MPPPPPRHCSGGGGGVQRQSFPVGRGLGVHGYTLEASDSSPASHHPHFLLALCAVGGGGGGRRVSPTSFTLLIELDLAALNCIFFSHFPLQYQNECIYFWVIVNISGNCSINYSFYISLFLSTILPSLPLLSNTCTSPPFSPRFLVGVSGDQSYVLCWWARWERKVSHNLGTLFCCSWIRCSKLIMKRKLWHDWFEFHWRQEWVKIATCTWHGSVTSSIEICLSVI